MSGSNTEQASQASEPEKQGKAGLTDEAAGSQHHEAGPRRRPIEVGANRVVLPGDSDDETKSSVGYHTSGSGALTGSTAEEAVVMRASGSPTPKKSKKSKKNGRRGRDKTARQRDYPTRRSSRRSPDTQRDDADNCDRRADKYRGGRDSSRERAESRRREHRSRSRSTSRRHGSRYDSRERSSRDRRQSSYRQRSSLEDRPPSRHRSSSRSSRRDHEELSKSRDVNRPRRERAPAPLPKSSSKKSSSQKYKAGDEIGPSKKTCSGSRGKAGRQGDSPLRRSAYLLPANRQDDYDDYDYRRGNYRDGRGRSRERDNRPRSRSADRPYESCYDSRERYSSDYRRPSHRRDTSRKRYSPNRRWSPGQRQLNEQCKWEREQGKMSKDSAKMRILQDEKSGRSQRRAHRSNRHDRDKSEPAEDPLVRGPQVRSPAFRGEVDSRDVRFPGESDFHGGAGSRDDDFRGRADSRVADFRVYRDDEFRGEVDSRDVRFPGESDFHGGAGSRDDDFRGRADSRVADFRVYRDDEFRGEVDSRDVRFPGESDFHGGAGSRDDDFRGRADSRVADFRVYRDDEFRGEVDSRDVRFPGESDFHGGAGSRDDDFRGRADSRVADFRVSRCDGRYYADVDARCGYLRADCGDSCDGENESDHRASSRAREHFQAFLYDSRVDYPIDFIPGLDRTELLFINDCHDFWDDAPDRVTLQHGNGTVPAPNGNILNKQRVVAMLFMDESSPVYEWDPVRVSVTSQPQAMCYSIALENLALAEQFALMQSALLDAGYCVKNLVPDIRRGFAPVSLWSRQEILSVLLKLRVALAEEVAAVQSANVLARTPVSVLPSCRPKAVSAQCVQAAQGSAFCDWRPDSVSSQVVPTSRGPVSPHARAVQGARWVDPQLVQSFDPGYVLDPAIGASDMMPLNSASQSANPITTVNPIQPSVSSLQCETVTDDAQRPAFHQPTALSGCTSVTVREATISHVPRQLAGGEALRELTLSHVTRSRHISAKMPAISLILSEVASSDACASISTIVNEALFSQPSEDSETLYSTHVAEVRRQHRIGVPVHPVYPEPTVRIKPSDGIDHEAPVSEVALPLDAGGDGMAKHRTRVPSNDQHNVAEPVLPKAPRTVDAAKRSKSGGDVTDLACQRFPSHVADPGVFLSTGASGNILTTEPACLTTKRATDSTGRVFGGSSMRGSAYERFVPSDQVNSRFSPAWCKNEPHSMNRRDKGQEPASSLQARTTSTTMHADGNQHVSDKAQAPPKSGFDGQQEFTPITDPDLYALTSVVLTTTRGAISGRNGIPVLRSHIAGDPRAHGLGRPKGCDVPSKSRRRVCSRSRGKAGKRAATSL